MNVETLKAISGFLDTTRVSPSDKVTVEPWFDKTVVVTVWCDTKNMPCNDGDMLTLSSRTGCPEIMVCFIDSASAHSEQRVRPGSDK